MGSVEQARFAGASAGLSGGAGTLRRAALVLGAGVGLSAGFSGLYFGTLSIFLKPVAGAFNWSRAQAASLPSMAMLGFAIGAPLLGLLIDRIGARRLIVGSAILFASLLLTVSVLPGDYGLFVIVSMAIGLLGVGTGPPGYMAVLPQVFDKRLGLALSFSMMGAGVGAAVLPLVTQHLVTAMGWRDAYRGLALIALVAGLLAYLLLNIGQKQALYAHGRTAAASPQLGSTFAQAIRDRRLWVLLSVIFVATAGGLGATVHVAALFTDRGLSPAKAAAIGAFSGLGLLLGRFGTGLLMDIIFAPIIAAAGFVLGAAGLATIALYPTGPFALLAASALLFGFALGAEGDFAAFAVRRYFGTKAFGAIYGAVITAYSLGGIAGPILFGVGYDRLGNYALVLLVAVAGYLLSALAVLTLGPYRWGRP